MTDSHQAIYDAVRSRISNSDIDSVIRNTIHELNIGHYVQMALEEVAHAGRMQQRPSVLYRPALSADGSMWMALLGDNLQEGVAGFGETPSAAMEAFDKAFYNDPTPKAAFLKRETEAGE